MSFTSKATGTVYQPGYFLENAEDAIRETKQIKQSGATTAENGAKYVKMGTVYPANDGTAVGIVYEDVDVTSGDMPGSVVTRGTVYESRLRRNQQHRQERADEKGLLLHRRRSRDGSPVLTKGEYYADSVF